MTHVDYEKSLLQTAECLVFLRDNQAKKQKGDGGPYGEPFRNVALQIFSRIVQIDDQSFLKKPMSF